MNVLTYHAPRRLAVEEVEDKPLKGYQCRIKSIVSGISHGTEMNAYRGTAPYYTREMDPYTRLFKDIDTSRRLKYPIRSCDEESWFMGYSNVGRVVEVGSEVDGFSVGDIVFSHGTHQTVVNKNFRKIFKIPEGVNPEIFIFYTNLVTAYNAILDSRIKIGDTVVVSGLGVVGQLIAQLAKMSGAFQVIGVDPYENRLSAALANGLDIALNPTNFSDIAMEIKKLTNNRGADLVMEVSGNQAGLNEAIRMAAPDTTVTAVGWYQGSSILNLSEEFHQNRITVRASQTLGTDPSIRHTYDQFRKDEICKELLPRLEVENLISHRVPFEDAPDAYHLIDQNPDRVLQVLLTYECGVER